MRRWIAGALALFNMANGLVMLFASSSWWVSVPGVPDTGPFNAHFVQDVGAAFLAAGLALASRAWRPSYWPAAMAGAAFLVAHAIIHLVMIAGGHDHHTAADLALVIGPAALALYSAFPTQENNDMRSFLARRMLRSFSKRYGYDTSYLDMLLKVSPAAFFKLAPLMKAAAHREVIPVEAKFAASITGALGEDCGPCTQLTVDMALEAGMARDQVEAVLRRDISAMTEATALGFQFADAVVHHAMDDDKYRDAVRARWGDKGVIDLAMTLQLGRMFPMLKLALGYARECRRVTVAGHQVDVVKQAA